MVRRSFWRLFRTFRLHTVGGSLGLASRLTPSDAGPSSRRCAASLAVVAIALLLPTAVRPQAETPRYGLTEPGVPPKTPRGLRGATPAAIPDIFGPGAVLNSGNVWMKITNNGLNGNLPVNAISSDPSAQWPGASGVEYLFVQVLAVGAVNPTATDPNAVRRVSSGREWFPPTADPEDRMYRSYDGIVKGARLINDDSDFNPFTGDPSVDEDFPDGRDNDADGRIDEDYAALGQLMFSCLMRDDTPAALAQVGAQVHVPLALECRQLAWCYSIPGFQNFNVIEYTIYNRSGHTLDSMYFGFPIDLDGGPVNLTTYFSDDMDLPYFPQGEFTVEVAADDPRHQLGAVSGVPACPVRNIRVNGFSVVDNDGDEGRTPGVVSFLLFGHTVDPLGLRGPARVGFRAFRSYISGTPYASNGAPGVDQQRFELMSSTQNIDPETGFIVAEPGDQQGDYIVWPSVGPFLRVPDGGSITATVGLAIDIGAYLDLLDYTADYERYRSGIDNRGQQPQMTLTDLFEKYPALENAYTAQVAYEGVYELPNPGFQDQVPDCQGCETGIKLPKGETPRLLAESCPDREAAQKLVTDNAFTWFDFDCDPCTGVFNEITQQGYYLRHWNAEAPPPSPNVNVASIYNYTDNPSRVAPAGDRVITLAWDNIAENTPDPKSGMFDFRSYRIWKVAGWRRPAGASGPNDEDWTLLGELRLFDYADSNFQRDPLADTLLCPRIFVPNHEYRSDHYHCAESTAGLFPGRVMLSYGGCRDTATMSVCLRRGDFWERQSGLVVRPDTTIGCVREDPADPTSACVRDSGRALGEEFIVRKARYPVGLHRFVDREVKNGFIYFYSVTAGDSGVGGELSGRRSAVEADAVVPQAAVATGKGVWVVPNPYRGFRNIADRSSSWDLTPNASDPTGTHIDFLGLPSGSWTIRIFTVAGDLVQELHQNDPVNDSVRGPVADAQGNILQGFNRQQDTPNDGQARWNLISRNGQDIVSGIYLFVVDSSQGQQRGRFVVVR